jgi:hypothetical protein
MKIFLGAIFLSFVSFLIPAAGHAQSYGCIGNNSRACVEARNAFAEHHGGMYPDQYYNAWYGGNRGRWYQQINDWRWEGVNGDRYWRDHDRWEWHRWHHHHHDD